MQIGIIGAGALGTFAKDHAYRWQGTRFTLWLGLIRSMAKPWFICHSELGEVHLPASNIHADVRDLPPCDLISITHKTTENHLLPQLLAPVINDENKNAGLQNGLGVEAEATLVIGERRVWGGLCLSASTK